MQQDYDFFRESSVMISSIIKAPISRRLLTRADIASVSLTIFEQNSPQSNDGVPVPYFENVALDKRKCVWDELQDGELENKYGKRVIQFNFAYILAACKVTADGVEQKVDPFPTVGKCYKVLFRFVSADPDIPDFSVQATGYAV
jgi:hypothetical protein